ncbi:HNH endonuclease signature motif containing protein [Undibacterium sp. Ji42W]|uniref:HNH endonuclease signature motif containing protein n=1 Tax=Undibacterium sp. Ji42W TaxID=3413039 RepID=UPI003BF44F44
MPKTAHAKAYDAAYEARPEQVKKRAMRNEARRELEKQGLVRKGDGKEVDHTKPLSGGGTNKRSNLRVISEEQNRGWRKGQSSYAPKKA